MKNLSQFMVVFLVGAFAACGGGDDDSPKRITETGMDMDPSDCAALSPTECAQNDDCFVISGLEFVYDATQDCYSQGESQDVGCMSVLYDCPAIIQNAGSGDGTCFEFGGCYPDGWSACTVEVCE